MSEPQQGSEPLGEGNNPSTQRTSSPTFNNLLQIRLPVTAVMSIVHRITGSAMVFAVPVLVWLLDRSLTDQKSFSQVADWLQAGPLRLLLLLALWGVMHHALAGIRYLLIDADLGVEREMARRTALGVLCGAPLLALLLWCMLLP